MPGKEFYPNMRLKGGIALGYLDLIESDFALPNGPAYTPPDLDNQPFQRIDVARTIQLLSSTPVMVETFQTSEGYIRLPASTASENTDDAGDGRMFVLKNAGTGSIVLSDYLGSSLQTIFPNVTVLIFGNELNNWDVFALTSSSTGGTGVLTPFVFSKLGGLPVNGYLYTGQVVASRTGQPVVGNNYIVKIAASASSNATTDTVLQVQRRTGLNTFADIAGASITILSGNFSSYSILSTPVSIGPDWELSCYNKSGGTLQDAIVIIFAVPR